MSRVILAHPKISSSFVAFVAPVFVTLHRVSATFYAVSATLFALSATPNPKSSSIYKVPVCTRLFPVCTPLFPVSAVVCAVSDTPVPATNMCALPNGHPCTVFEENERLHLCRRGPQHFAKLRLQVRTCCRDAHDTRRKAGTTRMRECTAGPCIHATPQQTRRPPRPP